MGFDEKIHKFKDKFSLSFEVSLYLKRSGNRLEKIEHFEPGIIDRSRNGIFTKTV